MERKSVRLSKKRRIIYDEESKTSESEDSQYEQEIKVDRLEVEMKNKISRFPLPEKVKDSLFQMSDDYFNQDMDSSDKYKIKKYLDGLMNIPFGKYASREIKKESSFSEKRDFLLKIKNGMDKYIFGQEKAKSMIIEIIAKRINNSEGNGNIIALSGPPGIGKTSLIRDGLAKSYGVPFKFVSLGGARHTSTLKGSDFSFIGAGWGKIVDILMKCECMDPIIFFDELDKVSISDEGMDIISSLTHLTDPSQNKEWEDSYYSGVPFDLSRATIIFSLNDENKLPEPLRDRITIVRMKGFDEKEKLEIANRYTIPKLCQDIGISKEKILFPMDTIRFIISEICQNEKGVRKLEQVLRSIIMKFNYFDMIELGKEEYKSFNPYRVDTFTAKMIMEMVN